MSRVLWILPRQPVNSDQAGAQLCRIDGWKIVELDRRIASRP